MSKLNTSSTQLISKLFNPMSGKAIAIRTDGHVLKKSPFTNGWKSLGKLKPNVSPSDFISTKINNGFRTLQRGDIPSFNEIQRMEFDGIATATDGCEGIEPDGLCEHGAPAWPQAMLAGLYR